MGGGGDFYGGGKFQDPLKPSEGRERRKGGRGEKRGGKGRGGNSQLTALIIKHRDSPQDLHINMRAPTQHQPQIFCRQ